MKPYLKWPGGKHRLLPQLQPLLPTGELCKRGAPYIEPFVGSGAMFFHLAEERLDGTRAVLGDLNEALVKTHRAVQNGSLKAIMRHLTVLRESHDSDAYYAVRKNFNDPKLNTTLEGFAARFIYLNKTCFNGIWRVNKEGEFNVPVGSYTDPEIFDPVVLTACRDALEDVQLRHAAFVELTLNYATRGAFVYLDPPYEPVSKTASFRGYTANGSHVRLAELRGLCVKLNALGARFMLSDSDTPAVREAFGCFNITEVSRSGSINSDVSKRGEVAELVIRNYK